jgi:hypothetical protein
MTDTDAAALMALDQRSTLAATAWAEARRVPRLVGVHSPVEEILAVMFVVKKRRDHFTRWRAVDASYKAICLAPSQFSCWNPDSDPASNHAALMVQVRLLVDQRSIPGGVLEPAEGEAAALAQIDPELAECLTLADDVIAGHLVDHTNGADSYYAPAAMVPPGRIPVGAVGRPKLLIGDQYFYTA